MEPSFLLSYWRPWDENSSLVDSWGDYLRDTSIAHYTAETIGRYINEASMANVRAVEEASQRQVAATKQAAIAHINAIKIAAELLGVEIKKVKEEVAGVNRRLDLSLEMQRTGLILQQNIAELLKIPDYEKERVNHISLGLQFLHNAENDQDLLCDALEELLKAEALKKQDYFVLHRIGCIYLFAPNLINPELAQDYFVRAGKYASIESEANAILLANQLNNAINGVYTEVTGNKAAIGLLAADSYEKAALSSYVLGDDKKAVSYQEKAVNCYDCPINRFNYSKYLFRVNDLDNAKQQLEIAVDGDPNMLNNALCDLDISSNTWTIEFVERKVAEADDELEEIVFESFKKGLDLSSDLGVLESMQIEKIGNRSPKSSYSEKRNLIAGFHQLSSSGTKELLNNCTLLLRAIEQEPIFNFSDDQMDKIRIILSPTIAPSLEDLQKGYDKIRGLLKTHIAKVGDMVSGGTILAILEDQEGWFGMMSTKRPIGIAKWATKDAVAFGAFLIKGDYGVDNMKEIEKYYDSPAVKLCRSCRAGGYSDWYLPSMKELNALAHAHKSFAPSEIVLSSNDLCYKGDTYKGKYCFYDMVLGMFSVHGQWYPTETARSVGNGDLVWPVRRFSISYSYLKNKYGIVI